MVTSKSKDYLFRWRLYFVLVLNALVRKSSDLLEFNQTHHAATFSSKCETFALEIYHTYVVLLDILFLLKVKLGTFLPIHRCAFWLNLKYIFVSLCKYSRTLRMTLLTWCRVISWARLFGSGRARAQVCRNISGLRRKLFYNIQSNDFFLSWRRFVVLAVVASVSEVIVIFLPLILFANTAAFFYSLLGLVSHCFWEGNSGEEISTQWRCVENINHSRDS